MLTAVAAPTQVLASARVGSGSEHLTAFTGSKPFGLVGTPAYGALNPHHQIPTLEDHEWSLISRVVISFLVQL